MFGLIDTEAGSVCIPSGQCTRISLLETRCYTLPHLSGTLDQWQLRQIVVQGVYKGSDPALMRSFQRYWRVLGLVV